jgi:hypothetical protein
MAARGHGQFSRSIRIMRDFVYATWRSREIRFASEYLNKLPVTLSPLKFPFRSDVSVTATVKGFLVQPKVNYISDYLGQVFEVKQRGYEHASSIRPKWPCRAKLVIEMILRSISGSSRTGKRHH